MKVDFSYIFQELIVLIGMPQPLNTWLPWWTWEGLEPAPQFIPIKSGDVWSLALVWLPGKPGGWKKGMFLFKDWDTLKCSHPWWNWAACPCPALYIQRGRMCWLCKSARQWDSSVGQPKDSPWPVLLLYNRDLLIVVLLSLSLGTRPLRAMLPP